MAQRSSEQPILNSAWGEPTEDHADGGLTIDDEGALEATV